MKIEKSDGKRRLIVTSEGKNICEFIHIYDKNGDKLGMITFWNFTDENTRIDFDKN